MLELRREQLAAGARPIGWKAGFGAPGGLALLGTTAPLVGFLTDRTVLESGVVVSLEGWANPMLEPEIALYLDGHGGITEIGPAIEIADLDPPPDDAESILGRNIYHRGVVLGSERAATAAGTAMRLLRNGEEVGATAEVEELTGPHAMLARLVSETVGELVQPGDVLIAGSITPPLPVRPGDRVRYELEPLGSLELTFAPAG